MPKVIVGVLMPLKIARHKIDSSGPSGVVQDLIEGVDLSVETAPACARNTPAVMAPMAP